MKAERFIWMRRQLLSPWLMAGVLSLIFLSPAPLFLAPYTIISITNILMYIVMTVSWAFFSGPTQYLSLATAAFFGIGIYVSALAGEVLPFPLVITLGGLVSFLVAVLVGFSTLRLRGMYFTIFTFGLSELMAFCPVVGGDRDGYGGSMGSDHGPHHSLLCDADNRHRAPRRHPGRTTLKIWVCFAQHR